MIKRFKYILYDYKVLSDIKLDIEVTDFEQEDIRFILKDGYCEHSFEGGMQWDTFQKNLKTEIIIVNAGSYMIGEKSITFKPYKDHDPRAVLLYLLGIVFGIFLVKLNRFPIHGSVVKINNKGIIFAGESGAGKSSISRGFIGKGYKLLSDDVALIIKESTYNVIPSFPSQKLWIDTADKFEVTTDINKKTNKEDEKFIIDISQDFCYEKLELDALIILEVSDKPLSIRKADLNETIALLLDHTYLSYLYEEFEKKGKHFKFIVDLARVVDMYIINRPDGEVTVNEQIELVINELNMNK